MCCMEPKMILSYIKAFILEPHRPRKVLTGDFKMIWTDLKKKKVSQVEPFFIGGFLLFCCVVQIMRVFSTCTQELPSQINKKYMQNRSLLCPVPDQDMRAWALGIGPQSGPDKGLPTAPSCPWSKDGSDEKNAENKFVRWLSACLCVTSLYTRECVVCVCMRLCVNVCVCVKLSNT